MLKDFFEDTRLKEIPASVKKQGPDQESVHALFNGSADEKRNAYLTSSPASYIESVESVESVTAPVCIIQSRDTPSARQATFYQEKMLVAGKAIDVYW